MMGSIITFFISIGIGAVIGGCTNYLAIVMLFRPYRPVYIGSWRLIGTPGVIPKRQQDLAEKLGELVEKQLLPAEVLSEKWERIFTSGELQRWLWEIWEKEIAQKTLAELSTSLLGITDLQARLRDKSEEWLRNRLFTAVDTWKAMTLGELLAWQEADLESNAHSISQGILSKLTDFLHTTQGKQFLSQMAQRLIEKQGGFLGGVLGFFFNEDMVVEKVRPMLLDLLQHPQTLRQLEQQLLSIQKDVLARKLDSLLSPEQSEQMVERLLNYVHHWIMKNVHIDQPIKELLQPWNEQMNGLIENIATLIYLEMQRKLPSVLEKISLAQLVREQVLGFPLPRLEAIIKEIARVELRMITWLGAIIGGLIGFMQALLVIFFS